MKTKTLRKSTFFQNEVRAVVRAIPRGEVRTYGEVAAAAGYPGAARAVGTVMKHNYDESVPCHRVVRSDGVLGEYNRGGASEKGARLEREGVTVRAGRAVRQSA